MEAHVVTLQCHQPVGWPNMNNQVYGTLRKSETQRVSFARLLHVDQDQEFYIFKEMGTFRWEPHLAGLQFRLFQQHILIRHPEAICMGRRDSESQTLQGYIPVSR